MRGADVHQVSNDIADIIVEDARRLFDTAKACNTVPVRLLREFQSAVAEQVMDRARFRDLVEKTRHALQAVTERRSGGSVIRESSVPVTQIRACLKDGYRILYVNPELCIAPDDVSSRGGGWRGRKSSRVAAAERARVDESVRTAMRCCVKARLLAGKTEKRKTSDGDKVKEEGEEDGDENSGCAAEEPAPSLEDSDRGEGLPTQSGVAADHDGEQVVDVECDECQVKHEKDADASFSAEKKESPSTADRNEDFHQADRGVEHDHDQTVSTGGSQHDSQTPADEEAVAHAQDGHDELGGSVSDDQVESQSKNGYIKSLESDSCRSSADDCGDEGNVSANDENLHVVKLDSDGDEVAEKSKHSDIDRRLDADDLKDLKDVNVVEDRPKSRARNFSSAQRAERDSIEDECEGKRECTDDDDDLAEVLRYLRQNPARDDHIQSLKTDVEKPTEMRIADDSTGHTKTSRKSRASRRQHKPDDSVEFDAFF